MRKFAAVTIAATGLTAPSLGMAAAVVAASELIFSKTLAVMLFGRRVGGVERRNDLVVVTARLAVA